MSTGQFVLILFAFFICYLLVGAFIAALWRRSNPYADDADATTCLVGVFWPLALLIYGVLLFANLYLIFIDWLASLGEKK